MMNQCIACCESLSLWKDHTTFPLCQQCSLDLFVCPPLCSLCADPACVPLACQKPWNHHTEIHSYSALYLLLSRTYRVLRCWKYHRGPLFDRQVLKMHPALLRVLQCFQGQVIIPIPQSFSRSWQLRGSPALMLAQWLSTWLEVPVRSYLQLSALKSLTQGVRVRQAQRDLLGRLQNPMRFEWRVDLLEDRLEASDRSLERVILVDDFMTSGRTVLRAARVIKQMHRETQIHVFCLGFRVASRFNV